MPIVSRASVVLIGAGLVSAFQLGKATALLPQLQADLQLDLAGASWLVSAFAIVGAIAGIPIGRAVDKTGARGMVVLGLALQAAAAAAATAWPAAAWVLATRVLEGLGFQLVVIGAPALIGGMVQGRGLAITMAAWSTFMPVGLALALLAAPPLGREGWRGLWWCGAALAVVFAVLVAFTSPRIAPARDAAPPLWRDLAQLWAAKVPVLLAVLFALFSAAYFAVFGFLPLLLQASVATGVLSESVLSAVAIGASAVGNLMAGGLLARGVRPAALCAVAFGLLAGLAVLFFGAQLSSWPAFGACVLFGAVAGLIPTSLLAKAPASAPRPELAGLTIGLLMQANNVGLVAGPALAAGLAARFGWHAVAWLVVLLACAGIGVALGVSRRDSVGLH